LPESAGNQPEITVNKNGLRSLAVPPAMARSHAPQRLIQPARGSIFGELLREVAAADRCPLSSRIRKLWTILQKLKPLQPGREPHQPPKPPGEPSHSLVKRERRPR